MFFRFFFGRLFLPNQNWSLVQLAQVQCAQWSFVTSHRDSRGDHNCLRRWLRRRVAREAATADLDLDLMLTSPPGSGLSRYKGVDCVFNDQSSTPSLFVPPKLGAAGSDRNRTVHLSGI